MITQYENSTLLPSASAQNTLCEIRQKALQLKLLFTNNGSGCFVHKQFASKKG